MTLQINPYQPYQVHVNYFLAPQQIQCLTQFYQPIMGGQALSLYLTLLHQPQERLDWSYRAMHARLLPILNMGLGDFNQARVRLEAVGLMRTYRDESSHSDYQRQTIIYDMRMPLLIKDFLQHPQLSLALFHQLGDEAFYSLIKQWQEEDGSIQQYSEISLPFNEVFSQQRMDHYRQEILQAVEDVDFREQFGKWAQLDGEELSKKFDQDLFFQVAHTEGVPQQALSQAVLNQAAILCQFYDLDEVAMVQVVRLALNPVSQQVDLNQMATYARKQQYYTTRTSQSSNQPSTGQVEGNPEDLQTQREAIVRDHPSFSEQEVDLVLICQSLQPSDFLKQIKEDAGGFATQSEYYYLDQLRKESRLPASVLNFLVYYLIVMKKMANFEKGWSFRLANEWQQKGIDSPAAALEYSYQQEDYQQKQEALKARRSKKRGSFQKDKRQEIVPAWLRDQQSQSREKPFTTVSSDSIPPVPSTKDQPHPASLKESEALLKQRIQDLLKGD